MFACFLQQGKHGSILNLTVSETAEMQALQQQTPPQRLHNDTVGRRPQAETPHDGNIRGAVATPRGSSQLRENTYRTPGLQETGAKGAASSRSIPLKEVTPPRQSISRVPSSSDPV